MSQRGRRGTTGEDLACQYLQGQGFGILERNYRCRVGELDILARDGDTLKVILGGACVGCAITPATLCGWVLGTVQQFFPEIERIEAIETPTDGD